MVKLIFKSTKAVTPFPKFPNQKAKRIVGLDPSTRKTGMIFMDAIKGMPPVIMHEELLKSKTTWDVLQKQTFMWEEIMARLATYGADLIVVEGYGMNLKNPGAIVPLIGLGEVLRYKLRQSMYPYLEPRPTELKLFATGKGNSDKTKMIHSAHAQGYETTSDDMADAFHLAKLGIVYSGLHSNPNVKQMEVCGQLKLN